MAKHFLEAHNNILGSQVLEDNWTFNVQSTFRKPLARQVGEFLNIRKAKVLGTTRMKGKEVEVQREVYNNKDEWFSHCSQWDTVG